MVRWVKFLLAEGPMALSDLADTMCNLFDSFLRFPYWKMLLKVYLCRKHLLIPRSKRDGYDLQIPFDHKIEPSNLLKSHLCCAPLMALAEMSYPQLWQKPPPAG
jgi:hypothetical protein